MPVITFLRDMMMAFKGPYERYVGRHTVNTCRDISRKKLPEELRKVLVISVVSADEVTAALLKVDRRRDISAFSELQPRKKPKHHLTKVALKAYMSALLVVFGVNKQQLLDSASLTEAEFLDLWINTYKYDNADMVLFNELLKNYQAGGIKELSVTLANAMTPYLYEQKVPLNAARIDFFIKNIADDAAAVLSQFGRRSGK